jgi:DNA-binding protein YbaB
MKEEYVSGTSTCGRVSVVVSCSGQVQSVKIHEEGLPNAEIEQAVLEASNQAGASAKQAYADAIRDLATGMELDIPGIDGLLTSFTGG